MISSVLTASIVFFSFGWFFAKNVGIGAKNSQNNTQAAVDENPDPVSRMRIRDIDDIWEILQESYYDASKLQQSKLEYGAVKGFVSGIGDPYTTFMTPEESVDFGNELDGQVEGIGAELGVKQGKLTVVAPIKESPAEKAGIRAGDIILKIDGALASDMTLDEAIHRIRGKKGTQVTLTIVRDTRQFDVTITRNSVTLDTVSVEKLPGDIFHVSIYQFNDHTKTEFQAAIQRVLLEKASGLILDLRGNGGGYLETSVDILSELISGEKTAAIIKRRNQQNEAVKTTGNAKIGEIPLAVLVDKGSASASEIVAGAIQDYKRGVLIGEKTFGKGSLQELDFLPDGSRLRFTIAKWFTPLDRSIDEVGITPDKEVKFTEEDAQQNRDPSLDEALKYLSR